MSTKAQLESENAKLVAQVDLLIRQNKNLKKVKPVTDPKMIVDPTWQGLLNTTKEDLAKAKIQLSDLSENLTKKSRMLLDKQAKVDTLLGMSRLKRLFLSKEDLKRLL